MGILGKDLNLILKCFSETNYLKVSSDIFFPQSTECLIPGVLPELLSGCVEGQ